MIYSICRASAQHWLSRPFRSSCALPFLAMWELLGRWAAWLCGPLPAPPADPPAALADLGEPVPPAALADIGDPVPPEAPVALADLEDLGEHVAPPPFAEDDGPPSPLPFAELGGPRPPQPSLELPGGHLTDIVIDERTSRIFEPLEFAPSPPPPPPCPCCYYNLAHDLSNGQALYTCGWQLRSSRRWVWNRGSSAFQAIAFTEDLEHCPCCVKAMMQQRTSTTRSCGWWYHYNSERWHWWHEGAAHGGTHHGRRWNPTPQALEDMLDLHLPDRRSRSSLAASSSTP